MKQESFTDIEYSYRKKKTKREEFLEIMDDIIPWDEWVLYTAVQKSGLSREVYLRKLIDEIQPRELPLPDFYPMMRQLYYCGNHLNQIARKAHALGCIDAEKYDEAVTEFRGIVEEISRKMV